MTDPLLSVVVPFYGVEAYIGDCLESIAVQSYSNIDVVMVDDGSPDGSRAIAQQWADRDSRFRIVTQPNAGLGPARNTGVKHTDGDYITFIDSDDLVTRHGFARMISAMETTGSSLAGGNARRFNNSTGVKPSWAHLHAFARTRYATHVTEHPVIARDRMVWNKVYRRSFWDEFGYEFPPIRYEDYPVTLKAHLDAVTVDILSEPVYYWRERESGDSITQQVFKYENLVDRVTSASMVIDLVANAPIEVRRRTHVMLAESDFVAIVQAFADVPDDQVDKFLDLGHDLVERLGIDALQRRTRYDQLQYHAMMARDTELLRELAVFRRDGGLRGGLRARRVTPRSRRFEYPYPGYDKKYLPRDVFLAPTKEMALRSAVNAVRWTDEGLVVRGTAEIRHLRSDSPGSATIKVRAVSKQVRQLLPIRRFDDIDSHGQLSAVGFEVTLTHAMLEHWADEDNPVRFDLQVGNKGVRRNALLKGLRPGSATMPAGTFVDGGWWVQPASTSAGELSLTYHQDTWQLLGAAVEGDEIVITARAPRPLQVGQFVLAGSRWAQELRYPADCVIDGATTTMTARLPLREIQRMSEDDDPYLRTTSRAVTVKAGGSKHQLRWTADRHTIGHRIDDHLFRLTRTPGNFTVLTESAIRLSSDSLAVEGEGAQATVVVRGRNWTGYDHFQVAWRRYLPGTEDFVETPATVVGDEWELRTPVATLLDVVGEPTDVDPLADLADWTLFCASETADLATAVLPGPFLVEQAPWVVVDGHHRGTIASRADTLHVAVREAAPPAPETAKGR